MPSDKESDLSSTQYSTQQRLQLDDDCCLFYKIFGATGEVRSVNPNQPVLIFLHGGPGVVDHSLYVPYWSPFSNRNDLNLQVIFIDHRGNGRSYSGDESNPDYGDPAKFTLSQWGQDVQEFFTKLGITKPIIAGVSFGGVVAMSCATQFPDQLGGLILVDTDAHFDIDRVVKKFSDKVTQNQGDEAKNNLVCKTARNMFTHTTEESYAKYLEICLPYCATSPHSTQLIESCVTNYPVSFQYNNNELTRFDFRESLSSVKCPILLLAGDQNPVHSLESANEIANACREDLLTFVVFQGAGSPVYNDQEKEVTKEIVAFINGIA